MSTYSPSGLTGAAINLADIAAALTSDLPVSISSNETAAGGSVVNTSSTSYAQVAGSNITITAKADELYLYVCKITVSRSTIADALHLTPHRATVAGNLTAYRPGFTATHGQGDPLLIIHFWKDTPPGSTLFDLRWKVAATGTGYSYTREAHLLTFKRRT